MEVPLVGGVFSQIWAWAQGRRSVEGVLGEGGPDRRYPVGDTVFLCIYGRPTNLKFVCQSNGVYVASFEEVGVADGDGSSSVSYYGVERHTV